MRPEQRKGGKPMLTTKEWEFAIISQDEARMAHVHWVPGRRLPLGAQGEVVLSCNLNVIGPN